MLDELVRKMTMSICTRARSRIQPTLLKRTSVEMQGCDEEAACLAAVGFAHQHQHRRVERGAEIDEAIGIGGSHVTYNIRYSTRQMPQRTFLGNQGEDGTNDVEVEKQFQDTGCRRRFTPSLGACTTAVSMPKMYMNTKKLALRRIGSNARLRQSFLMYFFPTHIFLLIMICSFFRNSFGISRDF